MTAQAILERAQSVGVNLHLDDGQVTLTGDKSAIGDLLPSLRQHRAELVQLLSKRAIDQMPVVPELARLLGAAMALCDRTNATDKTRQDWRADIEAALPEHRANLLALVQALMPKAMPPTVVAAAPNPAPTQTWRQHDKANQLHYWNCPQCLARGEDWHGQALHYRPAIARCLYRSRNP